MGGAFAHLTNRSLAYMAVVHRASVRICGGSFADNGSCIWVALLHISTVGLLYIWLLYFVYMSLIHRALVRIWGGLFC